MRHAPLLALVAACTVEGGKDVPLIVGEGPVSVDPQTQKITIDTNKVPEVGACSPGQVVRRTQTAWECAAPSVPWTSVTGQPSEFPAEAHTHPAAQITDFDAAVQSALNGGTVPGNLFVTGALSAASVSVTGTVSAGGLSLTGPISGDTALALQTGGVERMRVDAEGNVSIGTADGTTDDATTEMLEVAGPVRATALLAPGVIRQTKQVSTMTFNSIGVNTWTDVPAMSITLVTGSSTLLVFASGMYRVLNGAIGNLRLLVDDVARTGEYINQSPNPGSFHDSLAITWFEDVSPGSHTVKLQWKDETAIGEFGAGFGGDRVLSRNLQVIEVAR